MRYAIVCFLAVSFATPASAVILDLTLPMSSGSIGDGIFETTDLQPTRTGVIDPFVRIHNNGCDMATLNAQNLIYDMGAGNKIYLNYLLESGSGSGDMYFYLPWSLFVGLETQYVILYSKFGITGGDYDSNDGKE